jgi:hypothetical protein
MQITLTHCSFFKNKKGQKLTGKTCYRLGAEPTVDSVSFPESGEISKLWSDSGLPGELEVIERWEEGGNNVMVRIPIGTKPSQRQHFLNELQKLCS